MTYPSSAYILKELKQLVPVQIIVKILFSFQLEYYLTDWLELWPEVALDEALGVEQLERHRRNPEAA